MYLARAEPLGPHSDAITYILRAGGDEHLFGRSRFALWCVAHQRLQSHQILSGKEPSLDQMLWVSKLNVDRPDVHFSSDILHMSRLSAAAKSLTQNAWDSWTSSADEIGEFTQIERESQDLIASIEKWTTKTYGVSKPRTITTENVTQAHGLRDAFSICDPPYPRLNLHDHQDIWLAYKLNCHCASQIVFRESLVDLIKYKAGLQKQELGIDSTQRILAEQRAVEKLSEAIIRSYPLFLSVPDQKSEESPSPLQGRMAGRLFSIFPMWVIQRAQFTSDLDKQTALDVIKWVNYCHGLD